MEKYTAPELQIVEFGTSDVIITSDGWHDDTSEG